MPAAREPLAATRLLMELAQAPAAVAPILADLDAQAAAGHTGLNLPASAVHLLLDSGLASRPADGPPITPLVIDGTWLATRRSWRHESDLAQELARRAATQRSALHDPAVLAEAFPDSPAALAEGGVNWQQRALTTAWTHGLSLITGGPGCGKTTVAGWLAALACREARAAGTPVPRVLLAAPTGKAASRLGEAVRQAVTTAQVEPAEAAAITSWTSTLHRLFHDPRVAEVDLAIIDEVSMASAATLVRVLARLPRTARVVLLGDPDQLASVEPGRVLGDLATVQPTHPLALATVRLRVNWRSGAAPALAALVRGLQRNEDTALHHLEAPIPPDAATWIHRCDLPGSPTALVNSLLKHHHDWVQRLFGNATDDPANALLILAEVRLLSVLRNDLWGSEGLNQIWEARLRATGLANPDSRGHYPGRPLLVTRNRPDLGLANGDIGVVGQSSTGTVLQVPALDGIRAIPLHRLDHLEPAWFLTVHKAQGSQAAQVEVIGLPPTASPGQRELATREMAYTAITRSAQRLRIWWNEAGLHHAFATREGERRSSHLAELLRQSV